YRLRSRATPRPASSHREMPDSRDARSTHPPGKPLLEYSLANLRCRHLVPRSQVPAAIAVVVMSILCPFCAADRHVGTVRPERIADEMQAAIGKNGLEEGHRQGRRQTRRKRSEEHTSELQSRENLVCRLLLEKKNNKNQRQ